MSSMRDFVTPIFGCLRDEHADNVRSNFNRSPMPIQCPVELRQSQVHGNGVFAKRDIKEGEFVTFYPCDAYYIGEPAKDGSHAQIRFNSDMSDERCKELLMSSTYTLGSCGTGNMFIGDPDVTDNAWFLGHMINDGVAIIKRSGDIVTQCVVYTKASIARANVKIVNLRAGRQLCAVAMCATRDIQHGEEIFYTYDFPYWLSQVGCECNQEVMERVLIQCAR